MIKSIDYIAYPCWHNNKWLKNIKKEHVVLITQVDTSCDDVHDNLFRIVDKREKEIKNSIAFSLLKSYFSHKALWLAMAKKLQETFYSQHFVCRFIEMNVGNYHKLFYFPELKSDIKFLKEFPLAWKSIPFWYILVMKIYQRICIFAVTAGQIVFVPLFLIRRHGVTFKKVVPAKYDFVNEVFNVLNTVPNDVEWSHFTAFNEEKHSKFNK
ncbi:MAG: hypothetical protein QF864_09380, partial [SAR202 cluster bacterium]|nr:hypothetical protein [SAR202 cluster bacterium]